MVDKVELVDVPEGYLKVSIYVDNEGYVTTWGTALTAEGEEEHVLMLPETHPLITGEHSFSCYRLENEELIFCPDRQLINFKNFKKSELLETKNNKILEGFCYIINGKEYKVDYTKEGQEYLRSIYNHLLLVNEEDVIVSLKPVEANEKEDLTFTPDQFAVLLTYAELIEKWKESKYTDLLVPYIDSLTTVDEISLVTWDSVPDAPKPEIPDVTFNSRLKEEFDKLRQKQEVLQKSVDEVSELVMSILG